MRRSFLASAMLLLLGGCVTGAVQPPQPDTVVFFTGDSAALDDVARRTIARVAADARARSSPIRVRGFAAPPGSAAYNVALSEARARIVADNLVAAGLPASRVRVEALGEVPVEAALVESRRVEIIVEG